MEGNKRRWRSRGRRVVCDQLQHCVQTGLCQIMDSECSWHELPDKGSFKRVRECLFIRRRGDKDEWVFAEREPMLLP